MKKNIKLLLLSVFLLITFLLGICYTINRKETTLTNTAQTLSYADLKTIDQHKTLYVGDASRVGKIIGYLPQPDVYHVQKMFALETQTESKGLTVYYESNGYEGKNVPFWHSKMANNALVLFVFIDNLEQVTFAYRDTPSQNILKKEAYTHQYHYLRKDFIQERGSLEKLKTDLEVFNTLLLENLKIDAFHIHYNRIRLGDTFDKVIARNGKPYQLLKDEDLSYEMRYKNLGAVEYTSNTGEKKTITGDDVRLFLNHEGIEGVYAAYIKGQSEILVNLGIENDLTYTGITNKLGQPQKSEEDHGSISYQLFNETDEFVTFYFDELGNLKGHGFNTAAFKVNSE